MWAFVVVTISYITQLGPWLCPFVLLSYVWVFLLECLGCFVWSTEGVVVWPFVCIYCTVFCNYFECFSHFVAHLYSTAPGVSNHIGMKWVKAVLYSNIVYVCCFFTRVCYTRSLCSFFFARLRIFIVLCRGSICTQGFTRVLEIGMFSNFSRPGKSVKKQGTWISSWQFSCSSFSWYELRKLASAYLSVLFVFVVAAVFMLMLTENNSS